MIQLAHITPVEFSILPVVFFAGIAAGAAIVWRLASRRF